MALATHPGEQKRLIVLVPNSLAGNVALAHKVFWLAHRDHCEVLYLTLVDNDEELISITLSMATMKAVTSGNCLVVQSRLSQTALWLRTLREIYHPGDRIVCQEEQTVRNSFLKTMPITEFLHEALDVPVISLSGFYQPQQEQISQWMRTLAFWLGFLLILSLFTMVEIGLDRQLQGAFGKALLCVLATLEVGAVWAWEKITSK